MKRKTLYTLNTRILGRSLRLSSWITIGLLLDRIGASRTGWIVFFIIAGLYAVVFVVELLLFRQQEVDIQQWLRDHYEGEQSLRERWAGEREQERRGHP